MVLSGLIGHKLYVISLKRSRNRREKLKLTLDTMNVDYSFVDAVDGYDLNLLDAACAFSEEHESTNFETRPSLKPITPFEIACTLSHIKAIHSASLEKQSGALILEDDADFLCTDFFLLSQILNLAPENASYIQIQLLPAVAIDNLFFRFQDEKTFFEKKLRSPSVSFAASKLKHVQCHGTTAYFITNSGINNILNQVLSDGRIQFPCSREQAFLNRNLLADRYIYWAASDDHCSGYALRIPLITTSAVDSYLHEGHVADQKQARLSAIKIYNQFSNDDMYDLIKNYTNSSKE